MKRKLTCIECPIGCQLEIDVEGGHIISLTGNKCEKGPAYARQEIAAPMRVLSSTVLARGLELKMVPVRTSRPIPKAKLLEAMTEIKKIRLDRPVKVGDIIAKAFLGLDADLIASREVSRA
jgi:CxxC motif-containing protein